MDTFDQIAALIEPSLRDMGFELVQVRLLSGSPPTLQVMAEPVDRGAVMTVEHCADISRAVSALLDVADPLPSAYQLEVSSPGIDRPLVRIGDFERFKGMEAKLETDTAIEGRKRFRGVLHGVTDDAVTIEFEGQLWQVPHAHIRKAKLVLTDALIAASRDGRLQAMPQVGE